MSAALINTKVTEAVAAIETADWETAYTKLMAAQAFLTSRPRSKQGEVELEYDAASIEMLVKRVNRERHAAQGIQVVEVKYANPTS